ncbi:glycerophosphodiester phosphodiesterase [Pseudarthrobacter albicanus]|uniref:glycerophosphodiester phosphodiesterase n=1 Tax=Pseudarthrobacter albicanus TaxID=2823873 RepID=UPI001BAB6C5A|nr:glycerophosphodiester phosphodiesterase [Pseudarthrobacter albicanus]
MIKIAALLLGLVLCTGCAAAERTAPASTFTLVAHRGGALVYPESSQEAFDAVSRTKFPIETDLRQLQDGTLVPLHDATVNRTMAGVTGLPAGISLDQWKSARIKNPRGGAEGTPTTWQAMLDAYGGRNVLVPELKDGTMDVSGFARPIRSKGALDSVIVQTFSFTTAESPAKSGLHTLYLLNEGEEPDAAAIRATGIEYVGPHKSISGTYLLTLKASGLKVWPYTVNDEATASRLRQEGADGVFTDDPWTLSRQMHLG